MFSDWLLDELGNDIGVSVCAALGERRIRIDENDQSDHSVSDTHELVDAVVKRIFDDLVERSQTSNINAISLSIALGTQPMLRRDSREIGFVKADCTFPEGTSHFLVSGTRSNCQASLIQKIGKVEVSLVNGTTIVCSGSSEVARGRTTLCRCTPLTDANRFRLSCAD